MGVQSVLNLLRGGRGRGTTIKLCHAFLRLRKYRDSQEAVRVTLRDSRLDYAWRMACGASQGAGRICYSMRGGGGTREERQFSLKDCVKIV